MSERKSARARAFGPYVLKQTRTVVDKHTHRIVRAAPQLKPKRDANTPPNTPVAKPAICNFSHQPHKFGGLIDLLYDLLWSRVRCYSADRLFFQQFLAVVLRCPVAASRSGSSKRVRCAASVCVCWCASLKVFASVSAAERFSVPILVRCKHPLTPTQITHKFSGTRRTRPSPIV